MPPRPSKRGRGNLPPLPFFLENPVLASRSASAGFSASASISVSASTCASTSASSPILDFGDLNSLEKSGAEKRSFHADIWEQYNVYEGTQFTDGKEIAICKYCGGGPIFAPYRKGTSNFKRHYEACPSRPSGDKDELFVTRDGKLVHKVDQFHYKEIVCLSIIKHSYPISFAEHSGTRNVHKYLNDSCKPFSRHTAKNYIMKIHERERVFLRKS